MNQRPTKLLCKRTCSISDVCWYREGTWYDVVYNKNDKWSDKQKTLSILNGRGMVELYFVYTQQEREEYKNEKWYDGYGPRDYSKWFYTPDEVRIMKIDKSLENEYEKDNQK